MCGIAGIISRSLSEDDIAYYSNKFASSLRHRGPDDKGAWSDKENGIILSHRRLSIHDLSPLGAQPMHSPGNRYCIVFNGEIYNYRELRAKLNDIGYRFRGDSDTEVLLASIEEWGLVNAVKKFEGMFAFALWDKQLHTLHLCRDRVGEKPLYYGIQKGVFYFASELHAIEAVIPQEHLTISQYGLLHYLKYGYLSSPYSIYAGFFKLQPGSILTIKPQNVFGNTDDLQAVPYWSLSEIAETGIKSQFTDFDTAVETLDSTLQEVIKRQLLADVKVGLFLSGGIDSTTVTAIAQSVSAQQVKTFTIGYNEKEYDESGYATKVANHLGTDHTTLYLSSKDAKSVIPDLSTIYDEPFADSSQIPAYLVSKLSREHVTVCLSGDGGDELFAGYNRYIMTNRIWQKLDHVPFAVRDLISKLITMVPANLRDSVISLFYKNRQGSLQSKIQKLTDLLSSRNIMSAYDLLSSYWSHPEQLLKPPVDTEVFIPEQISTNEFVEQAMYVDQLRYLEGDNLAKTDRASMAVSLETRLPLLSHNVVELAWRIPLGMKIHKHVSKWVLRNVLYKYVPEHLINRPKMGFSVPIAQWLRGDLKEWAEDHFAALAHHELLRPEPILEAWKAHKSEKADFSNKLWTILMFLAWQQSRNNGTIVTR